MCATVPCAPVCPSEALSRDMTDITKARMGLAALVDRETCLAILGMRCEACWAACPVANRAITIETRLYPRTGIHTIFEPVVHSDHCTGCGKCEHACVLEKPAIRVFDRAEVKGEISGGYRFSWTGEATP